jgi:hypothetical protein
MIRSGARQNRPLVSVCPDCYRWRIASAKAGESHGAEVFPFGFVEDGAAGILHHHGGRRGFVPGRIQPQQSRCVLLHAQGKVKVAGPESLAPEDIPSDEPLSQEGIAVAFDLLG